MVCQFIELEIEARLRNQQSIQKSHEQAVGNNGLEPILPADQHQRNTDQQEELPGILFDAFAAVSREEQVMCCQRENSRSDQGDRQIKAVQPILQPGNGHKCQQPQCAADNDNISQPDMLWTRAIQEAAIPMYMQVNEHHNELHDEEQPKDGQQTGFQAGRLHTKNLSTQFKPGHVTGITSVVTVVTSTRAPIQASP